MTQAQPDVVDYARFLPTEIREGLRPGISTWWTWQGYDVHVLRDVRPLAPARLILIHGAGAHSGALFPMAQAMQSGCDLAVPDLPLYGLTQSPDPPGVTYGDWIDLLCAFVEAEDDGRPLILLGASIGGMVAYEVAHRTGRAAAVIATCLLDTKDPQARAHASRVAAMGRFAPSLVPLMRRYLDRVRVPIALVADAGSIANDAELVQACLKDPRGAGGRVPLGFLATWFTYPHTPPEEFTAPEVLLVHPGEDNWTPLELSERFLSRIAAPTTLVTLTNCGHFPIEQPGLTELREAVGDLVARVVLPRPEQAVDPSVERDPPVEPDPSVHPDPAGNPDRAAGPD